MGWRKNCRENADLILLILTLLIVWAHAEIRRNHVGSSSRDRGQSLIGTITQVRPKLDFLVIWLVGRERHRQTKHLFRLLLVGWLLLNTLSTLPIARELYGTGSFVRVPAFDSSQPFAYVLEILLHPAYRPYWPLFLAGQIGFLSLALWGVAPRLSLLMSYLLTENLHWLISPTLDGGNNLASVLLLLLPLVNTTGRSTPVDRVSRKLLVAISNGAFVLCQLQLCVVYLCAAMYKLQGPLWQNGMVLYYLLQTDYSHFIIRDHVGRFPMLAMFAAYATVAFQLSYPFLVWFKATRSIMLLSAFVFHVGIALIMGLFEFGLLLCLAQVLFYQERWSWWTLRQLSQIGRRLQLPTMSNVWLRQY
jgi:Vitamin K-dependent gamma-carboxylase